MRASCSSLFSDGILPPHGGRRILLSRFFLLSLRLPGGAVRGLCESRGVARAPRASAPASVAVCLLTAQLSLHFEFCIFCQHSALCTSISPSVTGHDSCLSRGSSSLKQELVSAPSSVSPMTVAPGSCTPLDQQLVKSTCSYVELALDDGELCWGLA